MKIVHVITRMILGGAQENTLLTCEGLCSRGHEVTLITGPALGPEGQLLDRARSGGYRVIELSSLRRPVCPIADFRAYTGLKRIIAELAPDIVHTHSAKAGILGRWAASALRSRTGSTGAAARPRIIHTIHGLAFHRYQSALLNHFYVAIERSAARCTDAFISVADAMTQQGLAAGIGTPEQFTTILSGLEIQTFLTQPDAEKLARLRRTLDIGPDAVVVATIARLADLKGHEYIIRAAQQLAAEYANVVWLFVGDGRLRRRIERQIERAGLTDRFRLAGLVVPDQVSLFLHASDILLHCSLREGLARALPQAMLCGKPVISFDIDGASQIVHDDKTGLLVQPKDVPALIKAQEMLICSHELRIRLGEAGKGLCQRQFSHDLMVDRIEALYRSQTARP